MNALRTFHAWQTANPSKFALTIIAALFATAAMMLAAR